jgi:branched-chain amino acid transport system substrate-binding protein
MKFLKIWLALGIVAVVIFALLAVLNVQKSEVVRIGAVLPLTGAEARQGELIRNGILLAQEEISRDGLELVIEDDKSDQKEAVSAYTVLRDIRDVKVILTIGSPVAMSLAPLANADKIVLFSIAAAPAYSSPDDYTFRVIPSAEEEGKDMADIVCKLNFTELAVVYLNNDYGVSAKNTFVGPYTSLCGKVVIEESFDAADTDFRTQILKIAAKKPKAVFVASWGKQAGAFIRQAHELGLDAQFLCGQACQNPDLIKEGGTAVEGLIYPYTYLDKNTSFYSIYLAKYGEEPTQVSERMYDVVRMIAELQMCKDNECLLDELYKMQFKGSSSVIHFDENGNVVEDFVLYQVKNGRFELFR